MSPETAKRHRTPSIERLPQPPSSDDDEEPLSKRRRTASDDVIKAPDSLFAGAEASPTLSSKPKRSRSGTPEPARRMSSSSEEDEAPLSKRRRMGQQIFSSQETPASDTPTNTPAQSGRTLANQSIGVQGEADENGDVANGDTASALTTGEVPPKLPSPLIAPTTLVDDIQDGVQPAPEKFNEVRSAKYKRILEEEQSGFVSFKLAHNDGRKENLVLLSRLKAVIQAQLPKMPREYIARVVYSREHFSYVVVRANREVIGGITFRPFEARKFAEIVFLAVLSGNQTSGYGARLMAHFKDYVRDTFGVQHLLTYADNFAIGFFKKQGFTSEITLEKAIWVGYIKDYEGATLLQCTFFPKVRYLEIYTIYAAHRKAVFQKIKEISQSHIVYPGLDAFKKGATHVNPQDIPGLQEAGWTPDIEEKIRGSDDTKSPMYYMLSQLLGELRENQNAWPFTEPVSGVPDYYDIIKHPMDLRTMGEHLEDGKYQSIAEFEAEFALIVQNCKIYNEDHTPYVKW
ncbi:uncharacterized protein SPPG_01510 [Spizellomyces punctatus DAOM BR117]|uniref:histone acetyltransferase n=1 Tax=Spizellomyces punctatus (strain DAOM BR117) TaxID=645134 RepID=A0A0L0HSJ6_SPIPD|nr:uncharacterized protein SPPG_01510 [Spizellomyces punctatus DAOM BR117]KND04068.1 hypothetical protein SPPG_01510 [Spizellomyces punctatus DAOM BR117]|eukprot:XP_016612107.1 hypothetical protein SPPG_01510 [Spizellomyces punctatus DAOM BR117]